MNIKTIFVVFLLSGLASGCASVIGGPADADGGPSEQQLIEQIEQDLEGMEKSSTIKVI